MAEIIELVAVEVDTRNATRRIRELERQFARLRNTSLGISIDTGSLRNATRNFDNLRRNFSRPLAINETNLIRSLNNITRRLDAARLAFVSFSTSLISGLVGASLGSVLLDAGRAAEFMNIQISRLPEVGNEAERVFTGLERIATRTGIAYEDLGQAFVNFSRTGVTANFTLEESVRLLSLLASTAARSPVSDEVFTALRRIFERGIAGGLGLEELNILFERIPELLPRVTQRLGVTRLELSKLGSNAAGARRILGALITELEELNRTDSFAGLTGTTLTGIFRSLRENIRGIGRDLILNTGFGEELRRRFASLNDSLISIRDNMDTVGRVASQVLQIFDVLASTVGILARTVLSFVGTFGDAFASLGRSVNAEAVGRFIGTGIGIGVLLGLRTYITRNITSLFSALFSSSLRPIVSSASRIHSVIDALTKRSSGAGFVEALALALKSFAFNLSRVISSLPSVIAGFGRFLITGQSLGSSISFLVTSLRGLGNSLRLLVPAFARLITDATRLTVIFTAISGILERLDLSFDIGTLSATTSRLEELNSKLRDSPEAAANLREEFARTFRETEAGLNALKAQLEDFLSPVQGETALDRIMDFLSDAPLLLADIPFNIGELFGISESTETELRRVIGNTRTALESARETLNSMNDTTQETETSTGNLATTFENAASSASLLASESNKVREFLDGLSNRISDTNTEIEILNRLGPGMSNVASIIANLSRESASLSREFDKVTESLDANTAENFRREFGILVSTLQSSNLELERTRVRLDALERLRNLDFDIQLATSPDELLDSVERAVREFSANISLLPSDEIRRLEEEFRNKQLVLTATTEFGNVIEEINRMNRELATATENTLLLNNMTAEEARIYERMIPVLDMVNELRSRLSTLNLPTEVVQEFERRLNELLGTYEELLRRNDAVTRSFSTGWNEAFRNFADRVNNMAETGKQVFDTLSSATSETISSFITDWTRGTRSAKEIFNSFVDNIFSSFARLASEQITSQLFGVLFGGQGRTVPGATPPFVGGGSGGGFLGSLLGGLRGFLGFHSGGFVKAERYHNGGRIGLRSDEVPAILQTGEFVLSRDMVRQMRRTGRTAPNVTVNISTPNAGSFLENSAEVTRRITESLRRRSY